MTRTGLQFTGTLLLIGFVGAYFWQIVALLALVWLCAWVMPARVAMLNSRHAEAMRLAERADQQDAWYVAGDARGIYGG